MQINTTKGLVLNVWKLIFAKYKTQNVNHTQLTITHNVSYSTHKLVHCRILLQINFCYWVDSYKLSQSFCCLRNQSISAHMILAQYILSAKVMMKDHSSSQNSDRPGSCRQIHIHPWINTDAKVNSREQLKQNKRKEERGEKKPNFKIHCTGFKRNGK